MGISGIIEVDYLEGTPARVDHKSGVVFISKKHFDKMDPVYRNFVLAHEEGHLVLNTKDEQMADEYAMKKMLKKNVPLTKILKSLTRVLQYDKDNHYGRTINIFEKLALYDLFVNNNKKLFNLLKNNNDMVTPVEDIYAMSFEGDFSDFLGLGKRAKERRDAKHEAKMAKKEARTAIKLARAEKEKAKADAIREGKYQPGTGLKNILSGAAEVAGAVLGTKKGEATETGDANETTTGDDKKKNYVTWIIIAVVVIILFVAAYFIFFKKKKK